MTERKIRVGVNGHDLKFWYPIQRMLESTGNYEFREDIWTGHDTHVDANSRSVIEWADVLVSEWALGNAVYYSRNKRPRQPHLIRFHLQERGTIYPNSIDYDNVDWVVFVGDHIQKECIQKFGIPSSKCMTIGNFVDVERYDRPKRGGADFAIGMIGTAPSRKRLDIALDTLDHLLELDPRYHLRVKGASPAAIPWLWARHSERAFYERIYERVNLPHFRHRVIFDPPGADVHYWLEMVGAILSPSDFESFHMAVAEGAASGSFPIVWEWDGAASIYPEFALVRSSEEAAAAIHFLNASASGPRYRLQAKQVIRQRYGKETICGAWDALLSGVRAGGKPAGRLGGKRSRNLLVVWAIDQWATFHRREMLEALAMNLGTCLDILVIEPGNHRQTIEKLGWASSEELDEVARGKLLPLAENLFRTRLLCGSAADGIHKPDDPLAVLDHMISAAYCEGVEVLHWVYKPDQAIKLDGRRFVYEVYDDYTYDFGTGAALDDVVDVERRALPAAEHVFFTSQPLMDRKAKSCRSASMAGNGVSFKAFASLRPRIASLGGRPVAGYLGNLSNFFDWELMRDVCFAMPDVDFVFHGQIETEKLGGRKACLEAMRQMRNVSFTGRVGRELGAAAVARYDALLIPFVVNEAMHAVNPLKLWEYFATGRPVVMTPMEAVSEPEPLVVTATGVEEWVDAIRRCLDPTDLGKPDLADMRIERADAHRWESITTCHADVVLKLVGKP